MDIPTHMFIGDGYILSESDSWKDIAYKMDYVYKYLCYNFDINEMIIILDIEELSDETFLEVIPSQYLENRTILIDECDGLMNLPDLSESADKSEICDTLNVFIRSIINGYYNTISPN